MMIQFPEHDLLDAAVITCQFYQPLAATPSPTTLTQLLSPQAETEFQSSDELRKQVRDLLRVGGFKPTGRSKPASEYLIRAASEGQLGSINLAVDVCNVVSLHSGLPISVFDRDLAEGALAIDIAQPGTSYVFNRSGQEMDIGGLLCVFDQLGPCANAVKDSQRTKTHDQTQSTTTVIWGTRQQPDYTRRVAEWYIQLLAPFADTSLDLP